MKKVIQIMTLALFANTLMVNVVNASMSPKVRVVIRNSPAGSAGTGESSGNTTEKEMVVGCAWVEEDGMPSKYTPMPFSVGGGKKVFFSQGNLEYKPSTNEWRIADHQWEGVELKTDVGYNTSQVGEGQTRYSNVDVSSTTDHYIDIFAWGTSGWDSGATRYMPYETSTTITDFTPGGNKNNDLSGDYAQADWGAAVSDKDNKYRTLTKDEWDYLLNKRQNAESLRNFGKLNCIYAENTENPEELTYIEGLFLFPDNYEGSTETDNNPLEYEAWAAMEEKGAIFLPISGFQGYQTVTYSWGETTEEKFIPFMHEDKARYWTSTHASEEEAYAVSFYYGCTVYGSITANKQYRNDRCSVRLVSDCYVMSGNGTELDPYQIKDVTDLDLVRNEIASGNTSVCAKLMNDIDLSGVDWEPLSPKFTSISDIKVFTGIFDGNNHSITNMKSQYGLFFIIGDNATIKDLTITGSIECNSATSSFIGGICSLIMHTNSSSTTTLDHVICNVDITSTVNPQNITGIGGLIGCAVSYKEGANLVMNNCSYKGTIRLPNAEKDITNVGGLIGSNDNTVTVQETNCSFDGAIITGTSTSIPVIQQRIKSGDNIIYDINGRKLNELQKGINILNGKIILIK